MIEERIDELIKVYEGLIYSNCRIIENHKKTLISKLDEGLYNHIQPDANKIKELRKENEYFRILLMFEGDLGNKPISRYVALLEVKKYGLFRNVPDNVPINEILRNCEIIR